jgi:MOSC domain-containing protein YiiM
MSAVLEHDERDNLIHKAGIMGIVLVDGDLKAGDSIKVVLPDEPYHPLERV